MTVLERIFEKKHAEVAGAKSLVSLCDLKAMVLDAEPPRGFIKALESAPELALITEVKKASPSRGVIRADFDALSVALDYQAAGAHALSVLTDEPYFQGSPENLRRAHDGTTLPCLRKDFIDDPYQVYEARAWGADAILLIVASLTPAQLNDLQALAHELGMDALVEAHTEEEIEIALLAESKLVGVNNRDLADFHTDLTIGERLLPLLKGRALAVSESALQTRADLDRMKDAGAKAVLIGTRFCKEPDIQRQVREVMGW